MNKLEKQLSDCVNCASSETSASKAKIAELADKIEAIKARAAQAEDTQAEAFKSEQVGGWEATAFDPTQGLQSKAATPGAKLRFDGLGTYLNMEA